MITVLGILILAAFVCTIAAALNKCPVWIPVLLLCVCELVRLLPAR